ncbi:MAG: hypothetical protein KGL35_25165, partial [Bradyrhizobium sp.]|nr:hypothetical protein [Bradyrhizobium sp.]
MNDSLLCFCGISSDQKDSSGSHLLFQNRLKKFVERPRMICQPIQHGGRRTELAGIAGLSGSPAEVVVGREHREGRFEVAELFREAERQPVQPTQENP